MRTTVMHYNNGKDYDLIDVINDYKLNFNRGNIIKYICRADKKGNEIQDLEKALDYLQREIEIIRNQRDVAIEDFKNGVTINYKTK
jgi:hypothetical protein